MIKILADTSALVSLEIKHLVSLASKVIQFSISSRICKELKEIADFNDVHGSSAREVLKLIESGIIVVSYVHVRKDHIKNIDQGEAEILTLAESGEYNFIITDDVKALPYMKSKAKVKVLTSVFVIRLLFDLSLLSRDARIGLAVERDRSAACDLPCAGEALFRHERCGGLTSELAVTSSDGSLPDPRTCGNNSLADVMANLKYTNDFSQEDISLEDLSQILWAGYGCIRHTLQKLYLHSNHTTIGVQ